MLYILIKIFMFGFLNITFLQKENQHDETFLGNIGRKMQK